MNSEVSMCPTEIVVDGDSGGPRGAARFVRLAILMSLGCVVLGCDDEAGADTPGAIDAGADANGAIDAGADATGAIDVGADANGADDAGPDAGGVSPDLLTINRPFFHPEGVARAGDGTLFVGSFGTGAVVQFAPGTEEAQDFLPAGTIQASAIGMLVDDTDDVLWVCGSDFGGMVPSELYRVSIGSASVDTRYPLPGGGFCNDLAMDDMGNLYVSDSAGRVLKLSAGADALEEWATSDRWLPDLDVFPLSLNGIAFGRDNTIHVGRVDTGAVFSVDIREDGSAGEITEIYAADGMGVDGMKERAPGELIMVKGNSLYRLVNDDSGAWVGSEIESLSEPTTFAFNGDASAAWVAQSQFGVLFDQDDDTNAELPFVVVRVDLLE